MPRLQISTSGPYGKRDITFLGETVKIVEKMINELSENYELNLHTSGDIQYGVPTRDLRFGNSCDTCAQNPKSESLTRPSVANNIESDLMSR